MNPITVASSSRTVGGRVDADTAIAARYRVQDASDAILLSMALISMHDASLGAGVFLYVYTKLQVRFPVSALQVYK